MHANDRPLLLGLIALEKEFVSAAELIDAFRAWREQPQGSIGQILASRGKLSPERVQSLEQLANESFRHTSNAAASTDGSPTTTWRNQSTSAAIEVLHPSESRSEVPHTPVKPEEADGTSARYKPRRLHARGGLGHVYLADDLELQRQVALKEIRSEAADDPMSRDRFVAEARITGNLEHPGIVPIYGLGVHDDGRPYYAMRFIEGQTLAEAIKKFHANPSADFKSLDFRQLLGRMIGVCNAVAFAHSRGIVHRDLKPQNVMLGPFGETLVVDWGLAKPFQTDKSEATVEWRPQWPSGRIPAERESVTAAGEVVGTPAYMSPEQAAGIAAAMGPLSDVYSLGGVLYALLSGQSPKSSEATDILEAVRQGKIDPPRKINPRVPPALAAICAKAMAHEAQKRYSTALELAADLERWLADERVATYPEPWTDTAFRWMRKHRLPVAVASVILLVSSIALSIGYAVVSKQRDIAEAARQDALAANERAHENAASTRQVIEQYLIRVGDDRLSMIPGLEGLRVEMANLAVERYRDLLKQQPDETSLVADAGMALRRSANLYRMVGQYEAASNLYDESIANLNRASAAGAASSPKYQQWLCETLCDRALLVARISGPKTALAPMREALAAGRQLEARQPTSTAARQVTARIAGDLAGLLSDVGQFDEAVRLASAAATTMQRAADNNRSLLANRLTAALSSVNLGQAQREAGKMPDAEKTLAAALERCNEYIKLSPTEPNTRFILARCKHETALVHIGAGQKENAGTELGEAVETLTKLTEEFPTIASFRRKLAEVLTDRARLALERNEMPGTEQIKEAISLLEQIEARQDEIGKKQYQKHIASAYLVAGETELKRGDAAAARSFLSRARDSHNRAQEFNPDNPDLAAEAARLDALAASAKP